MPRNIKKEKEWAKTKYARILADIDKDLANNLKEKLQMENKSIASWITDNAKKYLRNNGGIGMKRIDVKEFNYEERVGEKIWCVELITNDEDERSIEIYECQNKEAAEKECEYYNDRNQDDRYKYITIEYTVTTDGLEVV